MRLRPSWITSSTIDFCRVAATLRPTKESDIRTELWLPRSGWNGKLQAVAVGPGTDAIRPMMPVGQFRDTFIIAIDEEGIAIIDQHVAHERVLFERFMQQRRSSGGTIPAQALLEPATVHLSSTSASLLQSQLIFETIGRVVV